MEYLKINPRKTNISSIKIILSALLKKEVVVLPTDTIYGLSCLASSLAAIKHIYKIKKRNRNKPLIILVSSLAMLKKYAFVSSGQLDFLKENWLKSKRPTTVILRSRKNLPSETSSRETSLAVRLPKSIFLIKIIKKIGEPIVSTSLNLSHEDNLLDLKFLPNYFTKEKYIKLVVDTGPCLRKKASRLIDLRQIKHPVILRD